MPETRVCVIGAATNGNVGAAMMVETVKTNFSDSEIGLFSHYPKIDASTPRVPGLDIFDGSPAAIFPKLFLLSAAWRLLRPLRGLIERKSRSISFISRSSVCLDVSGISFSDGRLGPLIYNSAVLLPFLITQTPVIKLSQAIGPIRKPATRFAAKMFLSRCDWVFARGEVSMKALSRYCPSKSSIAPDLIYSVTSEKESLAVDQETTGPVVVIPSRVVMKKFDGVYGPGAYAASMGDLCRTLSESEKVIILPFASLPLDFRHNNDQKLCQEIANASGVALASSHTLMEYREIILKASLVITARFHGMIAAVSAGKKCVTTSWGHKYSEAVPKNLTTVEFLPWREISEEAILRKARKVMGSSLDARVAASLDEMKQQSLSQFSKVIGFVERSSSQKP